MKKDFKIIFEFFKNSTLTEKEIIHFQNELIIVYKDLKSFQLACSIFSLQLQLFNERRSNTSEATKRLTKVPKNRLKKKITKERTIFYLLNQLYHVKSKEVFLKNLREIGIYKGKISYELTDKEYFLIEKDYIKLQLNNLDRPIQKRKTIKKKSNRNHNKNSESVYDKLRYSKSIGKFISIRTK